MKIGLTYDLKADWVLGPGDPKDANAEFDKPQTIQDISAALERGGHQTEKIGHVRNLLARIDDLDVDIVFNICEGRGGRNRESQVPLLLEMKGIPFVGSDALTLGVTLDKVVAKKIFVADLVPTPRFFVARDTSCLSDQNTIGYPLIVKTSWEGTSKGLTVQSRVMDEAGLRRQVEMVVETYRQPALVEEFISGTEFTVAVLGNGQPQAMPAVQVSIDNDINLGDKFYSFERITSDNIRYVCPARISDDLHRKIQDIAVQAYQSVGCVDFGRVDFRVDHEGQPYVLEINPLPSLSKEDIFNVFPQVMGKSYDAMILQILDNALKRHGLLKEERQTASSC